MKQTTHARNWTDQPPEVEAAEIVVSNVKVGDDTLRAEVRAKSDGSTCYVTIGNLFGSSTVRCVGPVTALRVLGLAMEGRREQKLVKLPPGAVLMEGAGR